MSTAADAGHGPARGERWRLLSLPPLAASVVAGLLGDLPVDVAVPPARTPEAVRAAVVDADIVLGDWSGSLAVDAALIAAAPRLALVQQPSVGVDLVDLDACSEAGVPVANCAGTNTRSVAEWCLGAALACLRLTLVADAEIRVGEWPQLTLAGRGSRELAGARVGLVGMGAIGTACAAAFRALGADVAHWSRTRRDDPPWLDLDALAARSDVLVVVIALAPGTRGLLDRARLERLPAGAVLVTAARGGIVDETAVADLVRAGALAAAAFDVFAVEPLPGDSPLRADKRILLSPHAAGATRQASLRILTAVAANVGRAVRGEPLADVVNGVDPVVRRRG